MIMHILRVALLTFMLSLFVSALLASACLLRQILVDQRDNWWCPVCRLFNFIKLKIGDNNGK